MSDVRPPAVPASEPAAPPGVPPGVPTAPGAVSGPVGAARPVPTAAEVRLHDVTTIAATLGAPVVEAVTAAFQRPAGPGVAGTSAVATVTSNLHVNSPIDLISHLQNPAQLKICPELSANDSCPSVGYETWHNWGIVDLEGSDGSLPARTTFLPLSPYHVADAVRSAEAAGLTIRAHGSGLSFSDAVLPQTAPAPDANTATRSQLEAAYGTAMVTRHMKASLQHLLPGIRRTLFEPGYFFFVEAGISIDELNLLLDSSQPRLALPTMGGVGRQTVAGAFSTGTHGSDFDRPPLADAVRAMWLVGAGGTHHWIEPSNPMTDPQRLQGMFPCITAENIHYDDDLFRSALVSMGSMGVIYAVILAVDLQYSLMEINKRGTWEQLLQAPPTGAGKNLKAAMSGEWTHIDKYLTEYFPPDQFPRVGGGGLVNRALQVVINPIRNDDGSHDCIVTNRAEVPLQMQPSGTQAQDQPDVGSMIGQLLGDADFCAQVDWVTWAIGELLSPHPAGIDGLVGIVRDLIGKAEGEAEPWVVRTILTLLFDQALPAWDPHVPNTAPLVDLGYKVMAGTVPSFSSGSVTSVEAFFDLPMAVVFVERFLRTVDDMVAARQYPAGWISLRVCGETRAYLGMQQAAPTGCIEMSLIKTDHAISAVEQFEDLVVSMDGHLHWGQSNGRLGKALYPNADHWRQAQQKLGGATFTNRFMTRLGLA